MMRLFCFGILLVLFQGCKAADSMQIKDLGPILRSYGYAEVVPPATLYQPGTIVRFASVSDATPLTVDIICQTADALGPNAEVIHSPSIESSLTEKLKGSFSINATFMNLLTADAGFKAVKNITRKFSDIEVIELPAASLFKPGVRRESPCSDAIKLYRSQGQQVTMLKGAFKATITYEVEFDASANLSADAKQNLIRNLAGKLSLDGSSATTNSIKGTSLIWGVRDNASFIDARSAGFSSPNDLPDKPLLPPGGVVVRPSR